LKPKAKTKNIFFLSYLETIKKSEQNLAKFYQRELPAIRQYHIRLGVTTTVKRNGNNAAESNLEIAICQSAHRGAPVSTIEWYYFNNRILAQSARSLASQSRGTTTELLAQGVWVGDLFKLYTRARCVCVCPRGNQCVNNKGVSRY
jgi:hypothetical protein